MVTMIDELFDRQYRAGRSELNSAISAVAGRVKRAFGHAFAVLNRIEYSAPWSDRSGPARRP